MPTPNHPIKCGSGIRLRPPSLVDTPRDNETSGETVEVRNRWAIALLAAVAALVGAAAGAGASLIVSNNQIAASRELSADEFRHEQRQKVDSEVVAATHPLEDDLTFVDSDFRRVLGGDATTPFTDKINRDIVEHFKTLDSAIASLELVESTDVRAAAGAMRENLVSCLFLEADLGRALGGRSVDLNGVEVLKDRITQCHPTIRPSIESFIGAARDDLGFDDGARS